MYKSIGYVTIIFVIYGFTAYFSLYLLNSDIPKWIERTVVVLAIPIQLLCLPWIDMLSYLGLTEGEWIKAPSLKGFILLMSFYALVLYALLWLGITIWRRVQ